MDEKNKKNPKGTAFSYGDSAEIMPKGTKIKHNKNGTISFIVPKKEENKK